jgi:hypothetical protein
VIITLIGVLCLASCAVVALAAGPSETPAEYEDVAP